MVCARARFLARPRYLTLAKPQLFDYPKGVFAARPGPRAGPVDHPPALAQGPLGGRALIDPVAHAPGLEKLSIVFFPVHLITEQLPLLPVQQIRQLGDVGYAGCGRSRICQEFRV
jgi:hypothetical protein